MKIVGGVVQGSTVETLKEGEQVVPLSVVRQIVREELAAHQERLEVVTLKVDEDTLRNAVTLSSSRGKPRGFQG